MSRSRSEYVAVCLSGGIGWDNMATLKPWSEAVEARLVENYVHVQGRRAGQ